jgi:hypothetical protein
LFGDADGAAPPDMETRGLVGLYGFCGAERL